VTQLSVFDLSEKLQEGAKISVLDVRETSEWDAGHVEQASYMNYKFLQQRVGELGLAPGGQIAVMCAGGLCSSTACSILLMNGFNNVDSVTGEGECLGRSRTAHGR
jgi:hydroxyacylglutathione hydrolase